MPHIRRIVFLAHSDDIAKTGHMASAVISHMSPYFSQSVVHCKYLIFLVPEQMDFQVDF